MTEPPPCVSFSAVVNQVRLHTLYAYTVHIHCTHNGIMLSMMYMYYYTIIIIVIMYSRVWIDRYMYIVHYQNIMCSNNK